MTPMIDVVFLLLVFFVWTSSFETPEYDLLSSVAETPAGGSVENTDTPPPVESFDEIVIKLLIRDGLPVIEMSSARLASVDDVRDRIREIVALGVQPPVIIDPEPEVEMNVAVSVFDAAREGGADRVLYAIE
ncbi:MAG: biopolymer transporter ExbD [Planctomycetota bacterium]